MNKQIYVLGGGTISHVRNHLALCIPAFGSTAKKIARMCEERFPAMDTNLILTKMADSESLIETNEDVDAFITPLLVDKNTKVIFFNIGLCDFDGYVSPELSGKYAPRLHTSEGNQMMILTPTEKVIKKIRKERKDISLVAFKTTCGETEDEMYLAGLHLMKSNSCNLVLVNDTKTRVNMIVTPEEARYHVTRDREEALRELVDMTYHRSHLSFTHSTVVAGDPIPWESELVYPTLREVVNYCIEKNAYKPFNGATVGHFACKIGENTFLTSIRKSNFNDLAKNGLVKVVTNNDDTVISYGAKPSVGGQSQRIVFSEHKDYDCIVHFHCPIKPGSLVPVVSQREYECGSHECGQNTSNGLQRFDEYELSAVMLDHHGPNIVFHHSTPAEKVIAFIEANFDLRSKTGGPVN